MIGRPKRPERTPEPTPAPEPRVRTLADVDLDLAAAHREVEAAAESLNLARYADAVERFEALLDERFEMAGQS